MRFYFKLTVPKPLISPNADSNHTITQITTTTFKIDLIGPAIGIYVFINHSNTPTTTRTRTIDINDILVSYKKIIQSNL